MLLFIFILLATLAAGIYLGRISASQYTEGEPIVSRHFTRQEKYTAPQSNKADFTELLDIPPESSVPSIQEPGESVPSIKAQRVDIPHPDIAVRPAVAAATINTPITPAPAGSKSSTNNKMISRPATKKNATSRQNATSTSANTAVRAHGSSAITSEQQTKKSGGITDILAQSMPQRTREQQRELNKRFGQFSAALDRAIAKAFLPKSKREQNIEKYLNNSNNGGENNIANATAPITQQLAQQSKNVINSMGKNYGGAAAQKAQNIMNDFQNEMQQTLNGPGDSLEKQEAAQKVNNKYNKKLQKLNQEEALKKMRAQLQAEKNAYLTKLSEVYDAETVAQMRPLLDDYMNKRLAIWTTPQSDAQAAAQEIQLQEELRTAQEELLKKNSAGSAGDLTLIENERVREQLSAGGDNTPIFHQTQAAQQKRIASWQEEGKQIVDSFQSPEVKAQAQQIMDNLIKDRKALDAQAMEEGWTEKQRNLKDLEITDAANKQLLALQEQDYNRISAELYKDLPEPIRNRAEAVWQQYNKERVALSAVPMNQEERQKQLEDINRRELQAIQALFTQPQ